MLSRTSWRPSRRTGPFHVAARVAGSALLLLTLGCQLAPPLSSPVGPRARHAAIERAMEPFDIKDGELHARPGRGPAHPSALRNGLAAMERGDALDALHHLAVAVRPSSPDAYLPLARVLRRLHQLDRAAATLRRLIALEPDHADARYELGMVLTSAGRHSEAAVVFEGLTALAPERGDAHARLAASRHFLGDATGAAASLAAARRLGARVPSALGDRLATRSGSSRRAAQRDDVQSGEIQISDAVRLDAGGSAQAVETSIAGVGPRLVAAWNDQRDGGQSGVWRLGGAVSDDGGATWTESLVRPPGALAGDFEGDPMSAFDRRTGDAWIGGVTFFTDGAVYVARRRAGAGSFDAPVLVNGDPDLFYDKPLMTAGPGPGAPNTTRLYVTYSEGLQSSGDLGATWGPLVELGESLFEIAYQPRVDADGVLSIVSWDSGDTIWLRRSLDGGATVGPRRAVATRLDVWGLQDSSRVPGQFRAPSLPSLAVDADGSLYVAYADTTSTAGGDANLDIYLTRSTDGGVTWSTPRIVNGDAVSPGDQFAPWLEVDAAGRLHVLFFDTRFTPQSDGADFGLVDLSYAFSDDAGASWREVRITDAPSSSADAVWVGGPNVADYQFLGDYLGLTALEDGDVAVVYPAAVGGDFDIYSRRLRPPLFVDGFESGATAAWSLTVGTAAP